MSGRLLLIATHHKTGTVWMRRLFQGLAERLGWGFRRLADHAPVPVERLRASYPISVLYQDHGRFDPELRLINGDAGWHLIRDPRDALISGANYHGWSSEPWLSEPRASLGGKSYRAAIRTLDLPDAVRFEFSRSTGQSIRDMLSFDRHGGRVIDMRLEDLLRDADGRQSAHGFAALGLSGPALEAALKEFLATHAARQDRTERLHGHIQNLDTAQWRYLFDAELLRDFEAVFPDACQRLGYPPPEPALLRDEPLRRERYRIRYLIARGDRQAAAARLAACRAEITREPGGAEIVRRLQNMLAQGGQAASKAI